MRVALQVISIVCLVLLVVAICIYAWQIYLDHARAGRKTYKPKLLNIAFLLLCAAYVVGLIDRTLNSEKTFRDLVVKMGEIEWTNVGARGAPKPNARWPGHLLCVLRRKHADAEVLAMQLQSWPTLSIYT